MHSLLLAGAGRYQAQNIYFATEKLSLLSLGLPEPGVHLLSLWQLEPRCWTAQPAWNLLRREQRQMLAGSEATPSLVPLLTWHCIGASPTGKHFRLQIPCSHQGWGWNKTDRILRERQCSVMIEKVGVRQTWVQISYLPLMGCVAAGALFQLSEPQLH